MTDGQVAAAAGCSLVTVHRKRRQLGIPPANGRHPHTRLSWTKDEIALLGTLPDAEVAERLGISDNTVTRKRRELGIKSVFQAGLRPRTVSRWNRPEPLKDLTVLTTREFCLKYGISRQRVHQLRKKYQGTGPIK